MFYLLLLQNNNVVSNSSHALCVCVRTCVEGLDVIYTRLVNDYITHYMLTCNI